MTSKKGKIKEVDLYKQQLQMYEQMPEQMKAIHGLNDEEYIAEVERLRGLIELSNRGKRSRRKGASYENTIAKKFGEVHNIKLVRTPLSGGFQKQSDSEDFRGDLNCIEPNKDFKLHLECKNHKTWSMGKWWKQAEEDCPPGRVPALVVHRGQLIEEGKRVHTAEDFIMLKFEDFLHIVDAEKIIEIKEGKSNVPKRKISVRQKHRS